LKSQVAPLLAILVVLAQALAVNPLEAPQVLGFYVESKSSSTLIVKGNWSTNLTGVIDISKTINVSEKEIGLNARVYAKLAGKERGLNFTLNLDYNMSAVLEEDEVKSTTQFKLNYVDYGVLASLTPTRHLALEATGSDLTVIAEDKLNSTLKATIKPSTGNRVGDVMVASAIAYILNETLRTLKEELQKVNATLEYEVTLRQEDAVLELEVETVIPLEAKVKTVMLNLPTGVFETRISITLEQNQTSVKVELEVLTHKMDSEDLRKALNTLSSLTNITSERIEGTLDRIDRLLESLNNLITTLNGTLTAISTQWEAGIEAPRTPVESPIAATTPHETKTPETPEEQGRARTTLTLLITGLATIAILGASYIILTRRKTY